MEAELIDSHAHLAAPDFAEDIDQVIERARQAGVKEILVIGSGYGKQSAKAAAELADKYEHMFTAVGLHPCDSEKKLDKEWLLDIARGPKVRALGETGLDFYWGKTDPEIQKYNFRLHIEVALELKLPLVIHSRSAAADCLQILTEMQAQHAGGVFHCYSEDADFAKRLNQINFMVSFTGVLTFKKADLLRQAAKDIPLEQIMLETDCPYLAPQRVRGKRCEPAYVRDLAETLAEVKNMSIEEVGKATSLNARNLFKLI